MGWTHLQGGPTGAPNVCSVDESNKVRLWGLIWPVGCAKRTAPLQSPSNDSNGAPAPFM